MSDQPDHKNRLVSQLSGGYEARSQGNDLMPKTDLLHTMLEELLRAWLRTETAVEIGSDPRKVRLLKAINAEVDGEPSPLVKEVYQEVFLRDVWSRADAGNEPGRTA